VQDGLAEAYGVRAAFKQDKNGCPSFMAPSVWGEAARKFALARALGQYILFGDEGKGLATNGYSIQQQANRAFAAELLAPRVALLEELERFTDLERLAHSHTLDVRLLQHQMANNREKFTTPSF